MGNKEDHKAILKMEEMINDKNDSKYKHSYSRYSRCQAKPSHVFTHLILPTTLCDK